MATNGIACCALELPCCKPPGSRAGALAKIIRGAIGDGVAPSACVDAAQAILEKWDLVPAGVGKAIGEAYYPIIADAIAHAASETEPA